ncbi:MAG: glycosyltransferase [Planctomycetes bacterium]|nr:glycosyltransferase [Planctomycetota bacterium]
MRKLLLITREFPPVLSPPALRWGHLLRHLPSLGWEATVLTARASPVDLLDPEGLVRRLPPSLTVERVVPPLGDRLLLNLLRLKLGALVHVLSRDLLIPDPGVLDAGFWAGAARRSIERVRPDVLIVTGPPFSLWSVAAAASAGSRIPLVYDYRDPWTLPFLSHARRDSTCAVLRRQERRLLRRAEAALVASPSMARAMGEMWPDGEGRIHLLTNGADFSEPRAGVEGGGGPGDCPVIFLHAGSLHGDRSLRRFLAAARESLRRSPGLRIHVRGMGRIFEAPPHLLPPRLTIELLPQRPEREVAAECARADVLLLLQPAGKAVTLPAKTFEYLAARRPILALVPPGHDTDRLLAETGGALRVDGDSEEAVTSAILELGDPERRQRISNSLDTTKCAPYDRRRLAARLAAILDGIVTARPGATLR